MKTFFIIVLSIFLLWSLWTEWDRTNQWTESKSEIESLHTIRADSGCTRNIVAIQPFMLTTDYLSEKHFYEKIKTYFEKARDAGYLKKNTVVILPEYIGTWLVIASEKKSVAEAETLHGAMAIMAASNPLFFVRSLTDNQDERSSFAAAIFRMKARFMADFYASTFKQLAHDYEVTISAGSIVLPGPSVNNNTIKVNTSEPLYEASFVFTPTGIEQEVVKKSYPTSHELIKPWPIKDLPSFNLPIGKTAVLVCDDSWYPESYDQINKQHAEIVLVGSYDHSMNARWKGYDGGEQPADVDPADVTKITEQQAWIKYSLPGRLKSTNARVGVNTFLRGDLWDLENDGYPLIVIDGRLKEAGKKKGAGIYNICF